MKLWLLELITKYETYYHLYFICPHIWREVLELFYLRVSSHSYLNIYVLFNNDL